MALLCPLPYIDNPIASPTTSKQTDYFSSTMNSKQQPREAPKEMRKSLPPEILLIIFSYLDPDENKPDLLSLCRASTQFSKLAQPLLFQTFSKNPKQETDFESLLLFTASILKRPDLANKIRRITVRDLVTDLTGIFSPIDEWFPFPAAPNKEAVVDIIVGIHRLDICIASKSRCFQQFKTLQLGPLLGILFVNLPNLEELTVEINQFRWSNVAAILGFIGPTSNLKKINVVVDPRACGGIPIAQMLSVLSQPKLKHFTVNHCIPDLFRFTSGLPSELSLESPLELTSILTLSLRDTILDKYTLTRLLRFCTNLKSLTYSHNLMTFMFASQPPIDAVELEAVLQQTGRSLTHLDIQPGARYIDRNVKFQALNLMTDLKYLGVEQCCLTESPLLPPSLETLVLESCDAPVHNLVKYLTQESGRRLPNLRKVVVRPDTDACCCLLDIHPPITEVEYSSNPATRQHFCEKVRELEHEAEFGYFNFTVDCELYQFALNDMLLNKNDFY